eukprot:TRINITY_DN2406_c0_g1_i1.p1 TRINITY_DN2406_c0_g1~~TRINITY_DN2406_c0_g1_i1.p1  ORF type:complete len:109 (+),score=24.56 TRINITY_DN2406_c0_g1_i1:91-417(+)
MRGGSSEANTSAHDFTMLQRKLAETGERDRLKEYVLQTLSESGWREELKKHCIEFIQSKGIEKVTIEEITAEIAPRGRSTLPDSLKTELFNRLKTFSTQQGLYNIEGM